MAERVIPSNEDGFNTSMQEIFGDRALAKRSEDKYFRSYEQLHTHSLMLKDVKRTKSYMDAFERMKPEFQDKIILDVGAGTGILSIMAARIGAKHVYAIEPSETCHLARQIIEENGLKDRITVIQKKVEEITIGEDLPEKVDIIVSEWMGFCLLYEGMLDSVLWARDNLMVKGGLIFPERAKIFIAAFDDT